MGGAGGIRTLVQPSCRYTFYMLSYLLVVGRIAGQGTHQLLPYTLYLTAASGEAQQPARSSRCPFGVLNVPSLPGTKAI